MIPSNHELSNRELSIEELDAIAAGKFSWQDFFGAVSEGAGVGAIAVGAGAGVVGGFAAGPVGAVGGGVLGIVGGGIGGGLIFGGEYIVTHAF
jgi:hypothetical protein